MVGKSNHRNGGRVPDLAASDAYPAYETTLLEDYGQEVTTTPTGWPNRPMVPEKVPPPGLSDARVEKRRERGPVVNIVTRVVFGSMAAGGFSEGHADRAAIRRDRRGIRRIARTSLQPVASL